MEKIILIQKKSSIGRPLLQKNILKALGLKKIGDRKEHMSSSSVLGMVKKVEHMIEIQ